MSILISVVVVATHTVTVNTRKMLRTNRERINDLYARNIWIRVHVYMLLHQSTITNMDSWDEFVDFVMEYAPQQPRFIAANPIARTRGLRDYYYLYVYNENYTQAWKFYLGYCTAIYDDPYDV